MTSYLRPNYFNNGCPYDHKPCKLTFDPVTDEEAENLVCIRVYQSLNECPITNIEVIKTPTSQDDTVEQNEQVVYDQSKSNWQYVLQIRES